MTDKYPGGIEVHGRVTPEYATILTPEALAFVAKLHRAFEPRRQELLARRHARQKEFDAGQLPDFLPETKPIRDSEWKIADQPQDMLDRRVEITGPTDRKMVINALNCGASTFMADFEDANCPTWANMIEGQINLRDAVRRTITLEQGGKQYKLNDRTAVLIPRPRGWHLDEKHVKIDGQPVSGAIFDFALLLLPQRERAARARLRARTSTCRRWRATSRRGSGTTSSRWRRSELGVPQGTIRATALIETVSPRSRWTRSCGSCKDHSAGLNIGRWDYIFSCIKKFRSNQDFCLADRAQVTMTAPFMRAYALTLVKTCHRRNAPAMGGMAAQIPIKNDPVGERRRTRESPPGQAARGHRRLRRDLGRASGAGADRQGSVRRAHADAESVLAAASGREL